MAKEVMTPQEETLANAQSQAENFFEKNSKMVVMAIIAIFAIAIVVFGYKKLISEPRMNKAQEMLYEAQYLFEAATPDYSLALNGDESTPGFAEVAEQYGNTPAGNLAKMYAASCALRLGELDAAQEYINSYKSVKGIPGSMINALSEGIKGDIAVEKEEYAKAAACFEKAAEASINDFTTPMYLRKAAQAYRKVGDNAASEKCLNIIKNKYPGSSDAREAEKFIN
jgi:predicted negative regulator of RcsB-dependent stress response